MKKDYLYLCHIRDSIEKVQNYVVKGRSSFIKDSKTQDAVVRNFEILGEAVKNLSPEIKKRNPTIPWKKIAAMRDKMIHEYFNVNLEITWEVVEKYLPDFLEKNQGFNS